jgi:hypothetical protein
MSNNAFPIATETFKAGGTIVANTFVSGGPSSIAQTAAAATANGVAMQAGVTGDPIAVCTLGVYPVLAGAAIAENALVEADASGRAVTKAAGIALGRTRGAVAALGQLVEVDLFKVNV